MESIIRDTMIRYMMDNDLFCGGQYGFVPGSTFRGLVAV